MALVIAALAALALMERGQLPGRATVVRAVQVEAGDGTSRVVMHADGPLPEPLAGVLDDPPRIYFDFPGVTAATRGRAAAADPFIRRVRVALHQDAPLVTRVVIDLRQPMRHRVEAARREQGEFAVIFGGTLTDAGPTSAPPARATPERARRVRAEDRIRTAHLAALDRLERLGSLLSAIDARTDMPEAALQAAVDEFRSIRQALASLSPTAPISATHDNLMSICALGATAAGARLDAQQRGDDTRAWSAASAAAGARMLLDRTTAELRSIVPHP